ncbi:hypothetical protein RBB50_007524 [Rhinocladiella similis]
MACLFGIATCARISEEVFKSHIQRKTLDIERASDNLPPLDSKLNNLMSSTMKVFTTMVTLAVGEGPFNRAIRLQRRLERHCHWTTSTTHIHPAVA